MINGETQSNNSVKYSYSIQYRWKINNPEPDQCIISVLVVCHLEAILEANKPHGLNSLAFDQSLGAAHGIVKEISCLLGLPGNNDNGPEGTRHEHWEDNTRIARFNQAIYKRKDFEDLLESNSNPKLPLDKKLIAAFNTQD